LGFGGGGYLGLNSSSSDFFFLLNSAHQVTHNNLQAFFAPAWWTEVGSFACSWVGEARPVGFNPGVGELLLPADEAGHHLAMKG